MAGTLALAGGCTTLLPQDDIVRDDGPDGPACPENPPIRYLGYEAGAPQPGRRDEAQILASTSLGCEFAWRLAGRVVVSDGAELTVQAGLTIEAEIDAVLVVTSGSRLLAEGTRDEPIVFTSAQEFPNPDDWQGIALLGDAPTNANGSSLGILGDARGEFGGDSPGADCGQLRFVRVEFAGGNISAVGAPNAGLTLAGCGTGTTVDFLQVHRSTDGIGLFGGTVNLSHVIVSGPRGDGIEWTGGYVGAMQYVIVQAWPGSGAAIKGNNGEETPDATPRSDPLLSNVTLVGITERVTEAGNGFETGLVWQFGSRGTVQNAVVLGFSGFYANLGGDDVAGALAADEMGIRSAIFDATGGVSGTSLGDGFPELDEADDDDDGGFDERDFFVTNRTAIQITAIDPGLRDPFDNPANLDDDGRPDFSTLEIFIEDLCGSGVSDDRLDPEGLGFCGAIGRVRGVDENDVNWTELGEDAPWTDYPL